MGLMLWVAMCGKLVRRLGSGIRKEDSEKRIWSSVIIGG